jgi:hypothetical protein
MFLSATPEIRVETAGNDVTYWLPVRPLGKIRWFGLLPVGFSVLWLSGVGRMFLSMVHQLMTSKNPGFEYFMVAFLLIFVVVGCFPAGLGLLLMFGRCRLSWRNGRLTVSDSVGPFGWRRRMPRTAIRRFSVKSGVASNGQTVTTGPLASMAMLVAEFEKGKPRQVTMGYPREWLEAIATELSGYAARTQSTPPQVEVTDTRENPPQFQDIAEKPADSKVAIQRNAASIVLEVPPAGLRKGSMGLFPFACIWCLFMVLFTSASLFGKQGVQAKDFWTAALFLLGFWAIGLGMMAAAIHLGRRRATLTAGNSGLTVVQTGLFGTKRREFRHGEIAAVRADASNVEVNHRRVLELQIHPVTGKKVGLLVGRDAEELRWMATELRKALGIATQRESIATNPVTGPRTAPVSNPGLRIAATVIAVLILIAIPAFWHPGRSQKVLAPPAGAVQFHPDVQVPAAATQGTFADPAVQDSVIAGSIVFNSFGPSNTFGTNCWSIGSETHADWFVPAATGRLLAVELAIEPENHMPRAKKATVVIAKDKHGFPGGKLESFSVPATTPTGTDPVEPLVLKSLKQPVLKAGVKYWICANSPGRWIWHFNNQNIVHNSAREFQPRKWASAGDFCYVCAFSIMVTTNQQPSTPDN